MAIHTSCNEPWGDGIFVVSDHVKNWVWENEPSDELVFSGVVKVKELVVCGDTVDFGFLASLD